MSFRIKTIVLTALALLAFSSCSDSVKNLSNQEDIDNMMKELVANFGDEDVTSVDINGIGDTSDQIGSANVRYRKDGIYYETRYIDGAFEEPVKLNAQEALDISYKNMPSQKISEFSFDNVVATFEKAVPEITETFAKEGLTVSHTTLHNTSRNVSKPEDAITYIKVCITVKEESNTYYTANVKLDAKGNYTIDID